MKLAIAALLAAACAREGAGVVANEPPRDLAIVGVTVVHPADAREERDRTVVVSGGVITAVGPRATTRVPDGARVIDGRGSWVIPGLIDAHVHFFQSGDPFTRPDAADFRDVIPYTWEDARNRARLPATFATYLAAGVTSAVDPGGPMWNFDVRDLAAQSAVAPRLAVTGPLVSLVDDPKLDLGDPPIIKCATPDEARALVARELARHPDFIKVWFIHDKKGDLDKESEIVRAAADAAHAGHVRLFVHATELEVAKAALRSGADVLVHSAFDKPVDDDFIALMKERGAILIPTLYVRHGYSDVFSRTWAPTDEERHLADPDILAMMDAVPRPRAPRTIDDKPAFASLAKLVAAGVPVALGTDAGNVGTLHGAGVFREARLMIDAGLTPAQVLRAATVGGAAVLGLSDKLGDVAPGRLADLVVLDADPLTSVDHLARSRVVIRAGRAYDPAALMAELRSR
ncbi:MAG TPA: amidohydrolase family protein [Kofleriaceae bacterium]|nr:amidohydrolase family protein [Kofleriaceae bacterium]